MDVRAACEYIKDISYIPGWSILPMASSWDSDHVLWVEVEFLAQDSSRELAPLGYPSKIYAGDQFLIDLNEVHSFDQLDDIMIKHLIKIHEHEAREFFRHRTQGYRSWDAPYHPHQTRGNARWAENKVRS